MRSFLGRDILSLKDFERNEFFRVFEIAESLEPIARSRRNSDLLAEKTLVTAFYQPSTRTRSPQPSPPLMTGMLAHFAASCGAPCWKWRMTITSP